MAELTPFGYRRGSSILHRIDPRFKLLFVALVGLACWRASFTGLALVTGLFALLAADARVRAGALLKSLRWVLLLLGLVFAARALSEGGEPLAAAWGVAVTRQGILSGLLVGWRLLLVVLAGVFLSATTRAAEVRAAVHWLLEPIPRVPAGRVATMMGLLLRFVPLVLEQAAENAAARRARGIEARKNPVYRLRMAVIPLLRKSFQRADHLALAMEARCYSEARAAAGGLSASRVDGVALALVGGVCLAAALL